MIQTIRKAWGIPELQKKIVFTLLILLIYRIGSAIPVPYVDTATLKSYLDGMGTTILGLYNVMSVWLSGSYRGPVRSPYH